MTWSTHQADQHYPSNRKLFWLAKFDIRMRCNVSAQAIEADAFRFAASTPVEAEMIERLGLDNASPAEMALSRQPTRGKFLVIEAHDICLASSRSPISASCIRSSPVTCYLLPTFVPCSITQT